MSDLRKAAQAVIHAWDDPVGMPNLCRALDTLRAALAETTDWEAVAADQALTIALLRSEPTVPSDCANSRQSGPDAPCRYPDCVDNGPDGKCTRWLLGDCEKSEDYQR